MNTNQLKVLSWGTVLLLAAGLSGYLALFVRKLPETKQTVTPDEIREVLDAVRPEEVVASNLVAYDDIKASLTQLNWTGKEPPKEIIPEGPVEEEVPTSSRPVRDLVAIIMLAVDGDDPDLSIAVLGYKPDSGVTLVSAHQGIARPGDALKAPLDHIFVESVGSESVTFRFEDEAREHEVLTHEPSEVSGVFTFVGPDFVMPERDVDQWITSRRIAPPPEETVEIRPGHYRLGTNDVADINDNYTEILSRDIEHVRHRDSNGRYDGIQITRVAAGSQAAKHGLADGDIIKSINDHPVASVQEVIQFVKNNQELYNEWVVVIENRGRERTVTYNSPED